MMNQETSPQAAPCTRKEIRYKASEEKPLQCETTLAKCGLRRGTVIDVSRSGIRLLCEGAFEAGQPIFTELTTDKSHGIYKGRIRRVEPWVGGQSVIGCSLEDPIPDSVLTELAHEGAVNRRSDDRIPLEKTAKMSWPLSQQEIDVELLDFSPGGMKIIASAPIHDDVRLRFRIETARDEELVVEAKSVWVNPSDDGCVAGVVFANPESPKRIRHSLGLEGSELLAEEPASEVHKSDGRKRAVCGAALALSVAAAGYVALTLF